MKLSLKSIIIAGTISSSIFYSCGDDSASTSTSTDNQPKEQAPQDSSITRIIPVGKKVFSIPSPLQLSLLIQETGAEYDVTLLHDINNVTKYLDETKLALNMGVYGADLGYTSIYRQNTDAIGYMKAVKQLTDKLEIAEAFDQSIIETIERNLNEANKDSLLATISNAYRKTDGYLKDNKRTHVGALILAGGWVESVYFATRINEVEKNEEVKDRIGEQRKALDNILNILVKHYRKPGVDVIYTQLEELYTIFEEINISYTYEKPIVDVENRHTTITSKTNVDFTPETYRKICEKVAEIRKSIIE